MAPRTGNITSPTIPGPTRPITRPRFPTMTYLPTHSGLLQFRAAYRLAQLFRPPLDGCQTAGHERAQ
ncbi:hypothetical protein GCM10028799_70790 [Kribbella italica]